MAAQQRIPRDDFLRQAAPGGDFRATSAGMTGAAVFTKAGAAATMSHLCDSLARPATAGGHVDGWYCGFVMRRAMWPRD